MNQLITHYDGDDWTLAGQVKRNIEWIEQNGGYSQLSDDLVLWRAQHTAERDHNRWHHRYCS